MKFDPYRELDVDPAASPEEVRAAYRRRAKDTHPDAGGSAKAFEKTRRALSVLSDPKRRAKYDATGEIDEETPHNPFSAPVAIILDFISRAIGQYMAGQGGDPESVDLVAMMKQEFLRQVTQQRSEISKLESGIAKMRKVAKRFRKLRGDGMLTRAIETQAKVAETQRRGMEQRIRDLEMAVKMLDDWAFDAERQHFQTSTYGGFVGGFVT